MTAAKTRKRRAPARELLSVTASAEYLDVSERTIRQVIHADHLRAYQIWRRGMIRIARAVDMRHEHIYRIEQLRARPARCFSYHRMASSSSADASGSIRRW
ncbi:hypothetical protein EF847_15165 [Actinobacteria bacterium YIM 96077]|uniref:Helix-turn-helix domain-containing protein n=1 Tax=Phytoactinopolyspora halophila TaxID=1981511 RepID=A0A329QUB9_9ACTN|nr:hypothetical protein EF847_15165 [Actinobacteria bacterium YIM 96077]RAW15616.1 hypothetical protein DPM12_08175 [Phytoactinopolyspora halophila]